VTRKVTLDQARRIAVRAQLLDGCASGVLETVRRLGFLQVDPIATVATPQHLVPWSRLGPFDTAELDRLLWVERSLFEWNAFIWPIEALPLIRARMRRLRRATTYRRGPLPWHAGGGRDPGVAEHQARRRAGRPRRLRARRTGAGS